MISLTLKQLRYFQALAEYGHTDRRYTQNFGRSRLLAQCLLSGWRYIGCAARENGLYSAMQELLAAAAKGEAVSVLACASGAS